MRPRSLLAWQRMRVAHYLAETGLDWGRLYARENGGTYNNQYLVLDTKLFRPGEALQPGLLTIVEQIPGLVVQGDGTRELERGYFPSYNVPYFREIYAKSGYLDLDKRRGRAPGSEYQLAPRATILRRDHAKVRTMDDMKRLMRSNGYRDGDPLAATPWMAVCARGDVAPENASLAGCYDAKVSAVSLFAASMGAFVVNGPTNSGHLKTFRWSDVHVVHGAAYSAGSDQSGAANAARVQVAGSASHRGQPAVFDFHFELMEPNWPERASNAAATNDR